VQTGYIVNRRSLGLPNDHWPKENVLEIDQSSFYEKTDAWRSAAFVSEVQHFLDVPSHFVLEKKELLNELRFPFRERTRFPKHRRRHRHEVDRKALLFPRDGKSRPNAARAASRNSSADEALRFLPCLWVQKRIQGFERGCFSLSQYSPLSLLVASPSRTIAHRASQICSGSAFRSVPYRSHSSLPALLDGVAMAALRLPLFAPRAATCR
jgi:hypothetical protein